MLCFGAGLSQGKGGGGTCWKLPNAKRHAESKHVWSALTSVISVAEEEKEKEVQPMMVQFDHRHHQHHHHLSISTYMYLCNVAAHHISLSLSLSLHLQTKLHLQANVQLMPPSRRQSHPIDDGYVDTNYLHSSATNPKHSPKKSRSSLSLSKFNSQSPSVSNLSPKTLLPRKHQIATNLFF